MTISHSIRFQPCGFDYHRHWPKLVTEADLLILAAEVFHDVTVAGPSGIAVPEISKAGIGFNGRADSLQDRQPLLLPPPEQVPDRNGLDLALHLRVRTDGKPYDLLVKAVLLRMRHHLSDTCVIGSSRSWRHWAQAHHLAASVFGGHRQLGRSQLGDTTAGLVLVGRRWTDPRPARHPDGAGTPLMQLAAGHDRRTQPLQDRT
ncbi:hypothetical protein [Catellatospora methionotrophica]|uniref:hypothetical protein n=1 Tax=Catellatospora methionotrophica TaxID=121620 RepID=UPI0033FD1BBD